LVDTSLEDMLASGNLDMQPLRCVYISSELQMYPIMEIKNPYLAMLATSISDVSELHVGG